uniref:LIM zinc-binding domain-containing protein n=1 Tax=Labrus bergylta TaxID=56723 RepID=A0A3Q3EAK0_9LABR
METFGLRRTQSLKSLSGGQERSWVMPASTRWDRKSVFQLVQHYQSCADLTSDKKVDVKFQGSESCVDGGWRRMESRESFSLGGSGRSSNLSRSRSMESLPQRDTSGTKALCALFESKASLQQCFSSSPLCSVPNNSSKTGRQCPLQDWRSHNTSLKETSIQTNSTGDRGKVTNGLPESYDRSFRYSHDDKYSPSLTKGGSPSRQSRDRISLLSSVRDRSALYLSRAAATDCTGGSTHTEFSDTPVTRTKTTKFLSPAKEMCSACLTPVYPMEKMVANKLVLHNSCFCCKHCKKKLSIHNYSSLYGEFYCISHYQQLFKRKGNYDEGFGHKQHKDHWLQKNKCTDEPDAGSTPKMTKSTKSNLNTDGIRESYANVFVTKSPARQLGSSSSSTDVKGKLKMSWPPEKKSAGVNPSQQTYMKNKISDICKASSFSKSLSEHPKSDTNQVKVNHGGETKDKVKAMSSFSISDIKEVSKTTVYNSNEKVSSKETKTKNDPIKAGPFKHSVDGITPRVLNFSAPTREKSVTDTNQKPEQKNVTPTPKTNHIPNLKMQDNYPNKAKKSVRFSPKVDVAQYELSSQPNPGDKDKEDTTQLSDPTEDSMLSHSKGTKDVSNENNTNNLSLESKGEVFLEIPEFKRNRTISKTSNQEPEVKVESSQAELTVMDGDVEKVEESVDAFTDTIKSTQEVAEHQEPTERSDINPTVNPIKSENPSAPTEHLNREEAELEENKNQLGKTFDSANDQESVSLRKPVVRTKSLKGSAKPAEKPKAKFGSWSKGKSPLSKFFTTVGSDKTNKGEPKDVKKPDVKPSGGLLGRLFQSSSEMAEDTTKLETQEEKNDTNTDHKTIEESPCPEPNTQSQTVSKEPSDLLKTAASETLDELTAPERTDSTDDQDSDSQRSQSFCLSSTEPEKAESKDIPITVELESQASNELSIQSIAEQIDDEEFKAPFNDDIFGDSFSSANVDPFAIQINTDESAQTPNGLLDARDVEGQDLFGGALLDTNDGFHQESSDVFGSLEPSDPFSASLGDKVLSEVAPANTFSLLESQTDSISAAGEGMLSLTDSLIVPDSSSVNQTEDQSPFNPSGETNEQESNFDIFSSNDFLFTQSPADNEPHQDGASALTNQPSAFPDDIFGVSDVSGTVDAFSMLSPSSPQTSDSLNDLLGADTFSAVAPSAQTDLFAGDIFASEPQLLPVSEPNDVDFFGDSLLVSDNNSSEQPAKNTVTNSSWMDDLLG